MKLLLFTLQISFILNCLSGDRVTSDGIYLRKPFPSLTTGGGNKSQSTNKPTRDSIKEYEEFIKQSSGSPDKAINLINNVIKNAQLSGEDAILENAKRVREEILTEKENLIRVRGEELERIQSKFDIALNVWKESLKNIKSDANQQSRFKLALTGVGIAITVSIAALTAASPANLAIVAGLGSAGGGIITFQNALVEEGQTRVANARTHETMKTKGEKAVNEYYQSYTVMKIDPLGNNYVQNSIIAWRSIGDLETAAIQDIPLSTTEEIEASHQRSESEKTEVETSMKETIEKLKNEKSSRKSKLEKLTELKKAIDDAIKQK
ncbi:hypothetical protein ACE5IS_06210 [Leptospira wolffii]|uniref:Uncharacterized protein n=1 Tax=Leptospira wolffii TaxID=409998 RepID=A0ABV5BID6_9LEPT|nr:hypothetical protein [Leptospira wolffii]TGL54275.1 hypothetical protein EHQ61_03035 [Leptospira wolffii]